MASGSESKKIRKAKSAKAGSGKPSKAAKRSPKRQ
jgi:hypothetical protein